MSVGRLVPWSSWNEWQQAGSWLLSDDWQEQQLGLDMVAAWRCRGRVPLGVDITATLVETRLRDPWYRYSAPSGNSDHPQQQAGGGGSAVSGGPAAAGLAAVKGNGAMAAAAAAAAPAAVVTPPQAAPDTGLRCEYSMALVRMVNGIADSAQRGRVAASVAQLAAAAGLPRMLVDLRHEASHNELPALPALRLGAGAALTWLQAGYWAAQQDTLDGVEVKAQALLKEYLALLKAAAAKVAAERQAGGGYTDEDDIGGDMEGRPGPSAQQADEEKEGGVAAAYKASVAQKRRRGLMSDLRALIPVQATALLAPLLLDTSPALLDPPPATTPLWAAAAATATNGPANNGGGGSSQGNSALAPAAAAGGGADGGGGGAGGSGAGATGEQRDAGTGSGQREWAAWRANLQPLLVQWPSLGGLLLGGALSRLEQWASPPSPSLPSAATDSDAATLPVGDESADVEVPPAGGAAWAAGSGGGAGAVQRQWQDAGRALVLCGWVTGLLAMGQQLQQQRRRRQSQGKRKQLQAGVQADDAMAVGGGAESDGGSSGGWAPSREQAMRAVRLLLCLQRKLAAAARPSPDDDGDIGDMTASASAAGQPTAGAAAAAAAAAAMPQAAAARAVLAAVDQAMRTAASVLELDAATAQAARAALKLLPLAVPAAAAAPIAATAAAAAAAAGQRSNTATASAAGQADGGGSGDRGGLSELRQKLRAVQQQQQAMLQRLQAAAGGDGGGSGNGSATGALQPLQPPSTPPRKRFRPAAVWSPCAIGLLPDAFDPNGRLPKFDAPLNNGAGFPSPLPLFGAKTSANCADRAQQVLDTSCGNDTVGGVGTVDLPVATTAAAADGQQGGEVKPEAAIDDGVPGWMLQ